LIARDMRLRKRQDFEHARSRGRSVNNRLAVLIVHPNGLDHNRYAFTAGRRIGGAVQRNRAKRLLREAIRQLDPELRPGHDIILIARNRLQPETHQDEVNLAVRDLVRRAGLSSTLS
jgi:ribonuclease P protein component